MRWTQYLIPTTKEVPHDATVPSHQLMIRAGIIRQVVAGAYTYLPMGYRSLRKIEGIVREEMNRAGAIELHMPAMHPIEWWARTGRVAAMGDVLLRLAGGGDDWRSRTVLGPTHEEVITEIARAYVNSYKHLPMNLYQIQTKFRGEARPKSGVLRTREFLMKDAYSFHACKSGPGGLDETYERMYDAYRTIFSRCGLPYVAVEADSGAIGGDASHEFMVPTDAGEDYLVQSEDGAYAANLERAEVAPLPPVPGDGSAAPAMREVHTPGLRTIDEVSRFLHCTPEEMIKTIIYEVSPGASDGPGGHGDAAAARARGGDAGEARGAGRADARALVALVRGDHEVNESKLARAAGVAGVTAADPELIRALTGADVGFAGPVGLTARVIADQAVTRIAKGVTGANKTDYHLTDVVPGRDFDINASADIRMAVDGDRATNGSPLAFKKCIEIGHVFKLGTKYSAAMDAMFLDESGKPHPLIMGCYGIGLNRIMAAAIESLHDDKGIVWPVTIAPFEVMIVALDVRVEAVTSLAGELHDAFETAGVDVLLDDRDARPGFKFKDADLIGVPIRVTVGKRGLADGVVEVVVRRTGEVHKVPPGDAVATVRRLLNATTPTS
ncbi:MAG: proline--tRNA ligase [Phycisphaerae bacterium]